MKRLLSLIIALVLTISSLAACSPSETDNSYFIRIKRDGVGRLSVSLARISKENITLTEQELEEIYEGACNAFSAAYDLLSHDGTGGITALNAPVETVFDIDPLILPEIDRAFELSALTDGLYQPAGGVLTSAIRSGNIPDEAALASAHEHMGTDKFEFSDDRLTKNDPLAQIDLAAYAEGYALKETVNYLKDSAVAYGTVTYNGIAGVFGEKPDKKSFSVEIGDGDGGTFNITEGYVAFNSESFGIAYDYSDGVLDPTLHSCAVYSTDAETCAVLASVGYACGADSLLSLYKKEGLSFEAVLTDLEGTLICTDGAESTELYSPVTSAESE